MHLYNREQNRDPMFVDDDDRVEFMWMLTRYLSATRQTDSRGRPYKSFRGKVDLLAFAIMTNHFHLVLRQLVPGAVELMMNGVLSSYVRYFHKRHGGEGTMFEDRFRSALKTDRRSLLNAIAYVHDNHGLVCDCRFCSHRFYADGAGESPSWLAAESGLAKFGSVERYLAYREMRHGLSIIAD